MSHNTIPPSSRPDRVPNLVDYDAEHSAFRWIDAEARLEGLPGGGLNIAHEAVDRHAAGLLADRVALRFIHRDDTVTDLTYAELAKATSRFAEVLAMLGVGRGERVVTLAGRVPELYTAALGTLKAGAVFCPLFSAFGPEPIHQRLAKGNVAVLVTTASLYRRKVAALRERLPELRHVLLIDGGGDPDAGVHSLAELMAQMPGEAPPADTSAEDPALLQLSLIHISEPTRLLSISYAVFCLKKKKKKQKTKSNNIKKTMK